MRGTQQQQSGPPPSYQLDDGPTDTEAVLLMARSFGRYSDGDDASQNGRLACRLRSDANRARRHELAVARVAAAMQVDDIDGMLAALPDIDHEFICRFYDAVTDGGEL